MSSVRLALDGSLSADVPHGGPERKSYYIYCGRAGTSAALGWAPTARHTATTYYTLHVYCDSKKGERRERRGSKFGQFLASTARQRPMSVASLSSLTGAKTRLLQASVVGLRKREGGGCGGGGGPRDKHCASVYVLHTRRRCRCPGKSSSKMPCSI